MKQPSHRHPRPASALLFLHLIIYPRLHQSLEPPRPGPTRSDPRRPNPSRSAIGRRLLLPLLPRVARPRPFPQIPTSTSSPETCAALSPPPAAARHRTERTVPLGIQLSCDLRPPPRDPAGISRVSGAPAPRGLQFAGPDPLPGSPLSQVARAGSDRSWAVVACFPRVGADAPLLA